jgi:hypothetical protein
MSGTTSAKRAGEGSMLSTGGVPRIKSMTSKIKDKEVREIMEKIE